MSDTKNVTVNIMDRDYQIACPEDQRAELTVSASYLDKQMRTIRDSGKVIGLERIAVMAALNLSHELLQSSAQASEDTGGINEDALRPLDRKLEEALYQLRQLEIN